MERIGQSLGVLSGEDWTVTGGAKVEKIGQSLEVLKWRRLDSHWGF